jgi:hypothetical protein
MLKPIISQYYERLKTDEAKADELAVTYNKICQSLEYV